MIHDPCCLSIQPQQEALGHASNIVLFLLLHSLLRLYGPLVKAFHGTVSSPMNCAFCNMTGVKKIYIFDKNSKRSHKK